MPVPVGSAASALVLKYPHPRRIVAGPSRELVQSLNAYHEVIRFRSHCQGINPAEHNFMNGYLCKVGLDPKSLPIKDMGEYKARGGGDYCLLPAQLDNPKDYKDCNR